MNKQQCIPIKNCWLCGLGVSITNFNNIFRIQCNSCYKRGIIIKCENNDEHQCIKTWNESRILLTDTDIADITISISKDPNISNELLKKINGINTYNTHYNINNESASRFGYGAIIYPSGKIEYCNRPHIEVLLKYFNIDYDTLNPKNIDIIYEKILSSDTFVNNFIKIILYMTILNCHIPKNYNDDQIIALIDYLNIIKECYTSINNIEIENGIIEMRFATFDSAIEYLLKFIHG